MHHPDLCVSPRRDRLERREARAQGVLDSPLTEAGREQARAMGRALAQRVAGRRGYAPADVIVRVEPTRPRA